jgi:hypothetical protein
MPNNPCLRLLNGTILLLSHSSWSWLSHPQCPLRGSSWVTHGTSDSSTSVCFSLQRPLVYSEKRLKGWLKGNLNCRRFIRAKQRKSTPSPWEEQQVQEIALLCVFQTSTFYWVLWTWGLSIWKNWVIYHWHPEHGYASLTPPETDGRDPPLPGTLKQKLSLPRTLLNTIKVHFLMGAGGSRL